MGLDHPHWLLDDGQGPIPFDYTAARSAVGWIDGSDGVRGSSDDRPDPSPGSVLIHWYRTGDNNPFVVDGTVIDDTTYTRALSPLIGMGHRWAANANRRVGELLGFADTQTVMTGIKTVGSTTLGLAADEVNMVRFAQTGLDKMAGTADDYQVVLTLTEDCLAATVLVRLEPLFGDTGVCSADIAQLPNQNDPTPQHYGLVPDAVVSTTQLLIRINSDLKWFVFRDGFESGDISAWDLVVPSP